MINEILFMDGYGLYVWSAFAFTLLSFTVLYLITKTQFVRERNKFSSSSVFVVMLRTPTPFETRCSTIFSGEEDSDKVAFVIPLEKLSSLLSSSNGM